MIAILADIHGNLPALNAVLEDLPEVSQVWVLGDTVGELPYPCQVLDRLAGLAEAAPVYYIAGNKEVSLVEAHRGMHPDWWRGSQLRALAWAVDQLQPHHWDLLYSLSPTRCVQAAGYSALLCHGSPQSVRGLIYTSAQAFQALLDVPQQIVACGHIHQTRLFQSEEKLLINAGSLGISLQGVGGVACYALLDEERALSSRRGVFFRQVSYEVDSLITTIKQSELSELAPGILRAVILELQTGRPHVLSLVDHCRAYIHQCLGELPDPLPQNLWREAEQSWDGGEWLEGRML